MRACHYPPFCELAIFSLQVLRSQYEKELQSPYVSVQTKFNLAWGLVKSPRREDQVEGVKLLQGAHHALRYSTSS